MVVVELTVLSAFLADQLFLVCRSGGAVHLDTARWYGVHLEGESLPRRREKKLYIIFFTWALLDLPPAASCP